MSGAAAELPWDGTGRAGTGGDIDRLLALAHIVVSDVRDVSEGRWKGERRGDVHAAVAGIVARGRDLFDAIDDAVDAGGEEEHRVTAARLEAEMEEEAERAVREVERRRVEGVAAAPKRRRRRMGRQKKKKEGEDTPGSSDKPRRKRARVEGPAARIGAPGEGPGDRARADAMRAAVEARAECERGMARVERTVAECDKAGVRLHEGVLNALRNARAVLDRSGEGAAAAALRDMAAQLGQAENSLGRELRLHAEAKARAKAEGGGETDEARDRLRRVVEAFALADRVLYGERAAEEEVRGEAVPAGGTIPRADRFPRPKRRGGGQELDTAAALECVARRAPCAVIAPLPKGRVPSEAANRTPGPGAYTPAPQAAVKGAVIGPPPNRDAERRERRRQRSAPGPGQYDPRADDAGAVPGVAWRAPGSSADTPQRRRAGLIERARNAGAQAAMEAREAAAPAPPPLAARGPSFGHAPEPCAPVASSLPSPPLPSPPAAAFAARPRSAVDMSRGAARACAAPAAPRRPVSPRPLLDAFNDPALLGGTAPAPGPAQPSARAALAAAKRAAAARDREERLEAKLLADAARDALLPAPAATQPMSLGGPRDERAARVSGGMLGPGDAPTPGRRAAVANFASQRGRDDAGDAADPLLLTPDGEGLFLEPTDAGTKPRTAGGVIAPLPAAVSRRREDTLPPPSFPPPPAVADVRGVASFAASRGRDDAAAEDAADPLLAHAAEGSVWLSPRDTLQRPAVTGGAMSREARAPDEAKQAAARGGDALTLRPSALATAPDPTHAVFGTHEDYTVTAVEVDADYTSQELILDVGGSTSAARAPAASFGRSSALRFAKDPAPEPLSDLPPVPEDRPVPAFTGPGWGKPPARKPRPTEVAAKRRPGAVPRAALAALPAGRDKAPVPAAPVSKPRRVQAKVTKSGGTVRTPARRRRHRRGTQAPEAETRDFVAPERRESSGGGSSFGGASRFAAGHEAALDGREGLDPRHDAVTRRAAAVVFGTEERFPSEAKGDDDDGDDNSGVGGAAAAGERRAPAAVFGTARRWDDDASSVSSLSALSSAAPSSAAAEDAPAPGPFPIRRAGSSSASLVGSVSSLVKQRRGYGGLSHAMREAQDSRVRVAPTASAATSRTSDGGSVLRLDVDLRGATDHDDGDDDAAELARALSAAVIDREREHE